MSRTLSLFLIPALALLGLRASAQDAAAKPALKHREIRALRYPAISPDGSRIAFEYRGEIWTVPASGGEAKQIAQLQGWNSRPRWSPDGKTLAFDSDKNGNNDIFTIPVEGGEPRQITFHTAEDILSDWSADGKSLLFYGSRDTRLPALYSIRLEDGKLHEIARDDMALQAPVFSPDGKSVTYVRGRGDAWRKGYRGSANTDLWTVALAADPHPVRLTNTPGNENWPMYSPDGKWLYFTADREGSGGLWKMPAKGGSATPITRDKGRYIHYPNLARNGKTVLFESEFSLWTVDLTARHPEPKRLTVTAEVDDSTKVETRKFTAAASEMEPSPDGSMVALAIRGDIFVVTAESGAIRRITDTLARDYNPHWSPDGKTLAYVSDRDANTDIYLWDAASGATRRFTISPEPETSPVFSPDGRTLAFLRGNGGRDLVTVPVAGGPEKLVLRSAFLSSPRWSPDGRWLAYSKRTFSNVTNVFVAPAGGGEEVNISRYTGVNAGPIWSADGRHLAFYSNRSGANEIYSAALSKPSAPVTALSGGSESPAGPVQVSVDPAGIERRVKQLVSEPAGQKSSVLYTPDRKSILFAAVGTGGSAVWRMPVAGGKPVKMVDDLGTTLRLSGDGKTLFALSGTGKLRKCGIDGNNMAEIPYTVEIKVDSGEERRATFDQAWLLLHDTFYDPKMHGADWNAIRTRYRAVVDDCAMLADFHLLLAEMIGELNASHLGVSNTRPSTVPKETGHLGLWYDWSYAGPGLKVRDVLRDGPADTDEARVRAGEYVVAVDGKDVAPNEAFYQALADKAGKTVELLVNSRPERQGARTVKVTAVNKARYGDLLYEDMVQRQRELVQKLSGGRLAYLHIRQMNQPSLQRFERELITEAYDKEGLVLDVRNNPGGRIHDDLFAILTKKVHVYETPRDGLKMTQPFGAFTRPIILLINQGSFSDSEIFANGFRYDGLGKEVGVPTGGGVIGTQDRPLMDGRTTFRVPLTGWHAVDGRNLENWGVPPDYYVELLPEDVLTGRDPQTERAVKELLKQMDSSKTKKK